MLLCNAVFFVTPVCAESNEDKTIENSDVVLSDSTHLENLTFLYNHFNESEIAETFESYAGFSLNEDYLSQMIKCCLTKNRELGKTLEEKRNNKIDATKPSASRISYDDLFELSMIINNEAGSSWLPLSWKMKIGEVILNRVSSPEFPNTLYECIHAKGQYDIRNTGSTPDLESVKAASLLLSGRKVINNPAVVFQSNFKQGSGVHEILHDDILGNTYLCYSSNPELYQ